MRLESVLASCALFVCTSSAGIGRNPRAPVVQLPDPLNVTFNGASTNGIESFLNIRFGAETSGNNRFAPPKPFTYPPNTEVNASRAGAACPQAVVPEPGFPVLDNVTDISEDCLTLRVDRPAGTPPNAGLPVMVYIYGGGDTFGQIYDSAYDPTSLVTSAATKGFPVIYVAMNYRVGIFGFAASPALAAANSLNAGLLDQRLALEWVQKHIVAFGGDPDRVTIFGESDGATGVGLQITAYGGQVDNVPFRRAIMQSGGPTADLGTVGNFSANNTAVVTRMVNCTFSTSQQELACLRKLPMSTLLDVADQYANTFNPGGLDIFIPTAPSPFIPDSPSKLLATGQFARGIDIITGWNEDDNSLFVSPSINSSAGVAKTLQGPPSGLTANSTRQALALYPVTEFDSDDSEDVSAQYFRASRMGRDPQFSCASLLMVQANLKYSECETVSYLYVLNQTLFATFFAENDASFFGVSHFSDVPYVFNQASTRYASVATPSDRVLSSQMSGSWAAFAAHGAPAGANGTLSDWPQSDNRTLNLRVIGGPRAGIQDLTQYERLVERCEFWNSPLITREMEV